MQHGPGHCAVYRGLGMTFQDWVTLNAAAEAARIAAGLGTCDTCPSFCEPADGWPNTPTLTVADEARYGKNWTPPEGIAK